MQNTKRQKHQMKPLNTAHFDAFVLIFYIFRKKNYRINKSSRYLGNGHISLSTNSSSLSI